MPLALLLLFLIAPAKCETTDELVSRASILAFDHHDQDSYRTYEAAFNRAEEVRQKTSLALLLSSAPSKMTRLAPEVFALFAIEHASLLTPQELGSTLRVRGDRLFDQGRFEEARATYRKLTETKDLPESRMEYAIFQLGWVDLNLHQPLQAYELWNAWISAHPDGDLRDEMLRDVGRAWVEATLMDLHSPRSVALVSKGALSRAETEIVFKGMRLASKRADTANAQFHLGSALLGDASLAPLGKELVSSRALLKGTPCRAVKLTQDFKTRLEPELNWLIACAQSRAEGKERFEILTHAYENLEVQGSAHGLKIGIFQETGQIARACQESKLWAQEQMHDLEKSTISALIKNCLGDSDRAQTTAWILAHAQMGPLADLPVHWLSQIPEKLNFIRALPALRTTLMGASVVEDQFKLAVARQNWAELEAELREFSPLSKEGAPQAASSASYWIAVVLEHPIAEEAAFIQWAFNTVSKTAQSQLLPVLARNQNWREIWNHWELFEKTVLASADLREQVLVESLHHWNELSSLVQARTQSPLASEAAAIARLRAGESVQVDSSAPRTHCLADALLVTSLIHIQNQFKDLKFTFNARFENQLARRMLELKKLTSKVTTHSWTDPLLMARSRQILKESSQELAQAIESVLVQDPITRDQLREIAESVRKVGQTGSTS